MHTSPWAQLEFHDLLDLEFKFTRKEKESCKEGERERNVLFNDALNTYIYGYVASDIW